jgi:cell division topological specificity factor
MSSFFERIFGRGKLHSATTAKERLQFVLVHDRINLPPERLKAMKQEILEVISKYVAVSAEEVDIALEQRDRNKNFLRAEIPFSISLEYTDEAPGMDLDAEDGFEDFNGIDEESENLTESGLEEIDDTLPETNSAEGVVDSQSAADEDVDKDSKI